jgi:hypothetical protein
MNLDKCACGRPATRWFTRLALPDNGQLIRRYFRKLFPYCDRHAAEVQIAEELTRKEAEIWEVQNS